MCIGSLRTIFAFRLSYGTLNVFYLLVSFLLLTMIIILDLIMLLCWSGDDMIVMYVFALIVIHTFWPELLTKLIKWRLWEMELKWEKQKLTNSDAICRLKTIISLSPESQKSKLHEEVMKLCACMCVSCGILHTNCEIIG